MTLTAIGTSSQRLFQKLDGLLADMAALRTPDERAEGFAAKAKSAVKAASDVAHLSTAEAEGQPRIY